MNCIELQNYGICSAGIAIEQLPWDLPVRGKKKGLEQL
jgi:hypothetical protein